MVDAQSPVLTVLSAMITPVVVISACSSLILTTSNRATRVTDRLHEWSDQLTTLAGRSSETERVRESREMLFNQLDRYTSRARLLQRSLACFFIALGMFVATSVMIGVTGLAWVLGLEWLSFTVLPIAFSLIGSGLLFYGSMLLIGEARLALQTTDEEMDFLWRQGTRNAPTDLLQRQRARRSRMGWRRIGKRSESLDG